MSPPSQPRLPAHASSALRAFASEAPLHRVPIAAAVAEYAAALPPGSRVLDAGAGDAPYAELFAHCEHVTQEWTESPHAGARSADVIADLHDLPLPGGSFDGVLCTEVLEHLADPGRALRELHRVLRPDGRLLLTVPFVIELHEEPHDFQRFTSYALERLLDGAGFGVQEIRPLTSWWTTLAHLLRGAPGATSPDAAAAPLAHKLVTRSTRRLGRGLSRALPLLDRLDRRRALPLGWAVWAQRSPTD